MIRGHQFNKVEMVQYTTPETSDQAFEELVGKAGASGAGAGAPLPVEQAGGGRLLLSMARTYDIEFGFPVWEFTRRSAPLPMPGISGPEGQHQPTAGGRQVAPGAIPLNASGLATSRDVPALVEQYQNADGSVTVPEVLRPFLGVDVIR